MEPARTRPIAKADRDRIVEIWFEGWHDAHSSIVPETLVGLRTRQNFQERLDAEFAWVRVIGEESAPLGFTILRGDELHQFYVARHARGTGIAAILMRDAEWQFLSRGVTRPWLACAIGNMRAARFYERCGWSRIRTETVPSDTAGGPFLLDVWRYEKELRE